MARPRPIRLRGGARGLRVGDAAAARPDRARAPRARRGHRRVYSYRSASMGSTRLARRAGIQAASRATSASVSGAATKTAGSHGSTPNRKLAMKRARPAPPPRRRRPRRPPVACPGRRPSASPGRRRRQAPDGCRSPASAARPSRPSGRRCRSPRAAAPTAPNTVISHMLNRWREVERDHHLVHRPDLDTGSPVAWRSASWIGPLSA